MKEDIKVVECNSICEAESEFFRLKSEGRWQMVSVLKIKWSWKKWRYIATFSMKRVKKAYHFDDYLEDTAKAIAISQQAFNDYILLKRQHRNKKIT